MNSKINRIKEQGNMRLRQIEGTSATNEDKARAVAQVITETAELIKIVKG